jgi:hypothetical protein
MVGIIELLANVAVGSVESRRFVGASKVVLRRQGDRELELAVFLHFWKAAGLT